MKKNNGYVNLASYLAKDDQRNDHIKQLNKGFVKLDTGEIYFFKRSYADFAYREVIASQVAKYLQIPAVSYHLAKIPSYNGFDIGVISLDYRQDGHSYIVGMEILRNYYEDYLDKWDKNINNSTIYNNLEDIWNALEFRYQFMENRSYIVAKLMNQLIYNIFLFDIFFINSDRHYTNWEIDETEKDANINLLYDSEDIFLENSSHPRLTVNYENSKTSWYDNLDKFLQISSAFYGEMVYNFYRAITPIDLINIIYNYEKEYNCPIPLITKENIYQKYKEHYQKIGEVMKKVRVNGTQIHKY